MRRKTWTIIFAILLLLFAADFAYWRIAAEQLRGGFRVWADRQAAAGWAVSAGTLSVGGWPGTAAVVVPNLTIRHTGPDIPGELDVAAAVVTLSVSLFDPSFLTVSPTGPLHVRTGSGPGVVITGKPIAVVVPLLPSGSFSIGLHANNARIETASGTWHATAGLLNAHIGVEPASTRGDPGRLASFSAGAEAIALPSAVKSPLGPNIASLSLDGALNGKTPAARDPAHWAESWRDDGGSVEISRLAVVWGPLGIAATATLALDDQLQPMGSGNAKVAGYLPALDKLAAGGMLTKSAATAAKAVLSLMAGTAEGDEPSPVEVPLTLQYRTLSMRQVPLLRFPELDWPPR